MTNAVTLAPSSDKSPLARTLSIAAAAGLAAIVLGLGLCLYATFAVPSGEAVITGQDLQLKSGSGGSAEVTANGLLMRAPDARATPLLLSPPLGLPAASASRLSWSAVGLRPNQDLQVVWGSSLKPGRLMAYQPSATEQEEAAVNLNGKPGWSGRINQIGLLLRGPLPEPVLISSLTLAPATGACTASFNALIKAWSHREDWSQRSINFSLSGERPVLGLTPTLLVALWIGLAVLIHLGLCRGCARSHHAMAVFLLFAIGWLVLDLRWQGQLWSRLADSHNRYADLEQTERPSAAPDGALFDLTQRLLTQLPNEPARVLILSAKANDYLGGRTAYHLLPHQVQDGLTRLPKPSEVKPGDYLILLESIQTIRYDDRQQTLEMNGLSLPVEPIQSVRGFGALFRVRKAT